MTDTQKATSKVTVSQTALEAVLRDIQTGNADYVKTFFAARPDWLEDGKEDKQQKTAQA